MKKHLNEMHGAMRKHAEHHDALEKKCKDLKNWYDEEAVWDESDKLVLLVHLCDCMHLLQEKLDLLHERHEDLAHTFYAHMCVSHGICPPDQVHDHAPMA